MSKATPTGNFPDVPAEADWQTWPRSNAIALLYRQTQQKISAMARHGRLVKYRCPDRSVRCDPEQCRLCFGEPRPVESHPDNPELDEELASDVGNRLEEGTLRSVMQELASLLRESRADRSAAVKQAAAERKEILTLVLAPAGALQEMQRQTIADMREELASLREMAANSIRLQQELLNQQAERDLAKLQVERREKRRDQAVEQALPHFIELVGKLGANAETRKFITGLDPALIHLAKEHGALTAEQLEFLERYGAPMNGKVPDA